jgi:hypothetical protein
VLHALHCLEAEHTVFHKWRCECGQQHQSLGCFGACEVMLPRAAQGGSLLSLCEWCS